MLSAPSQESRFGMIGSGSIFDTCYKDETVQNKESIYAFTNQYHQQPTSLTTSNLHPSKRPKVAACRRTAKAKEIAKSVKIF